jgi:carbon monoxide dehydrogenase subunit G
MARYQTSFSVPLAPDAVCSYIADVTNTAQWDPSVVEATRLDDGPLVAGARFRVVVGLFGRRIELTDVIERLEAPHTVVRKGTGKSVVSTVTVTVEPDGTGARVTYDAHLALKGALRLLDKGMQLQFTTMSERAVAGLTTALGGVPAS